MFVGHMGAALAGKVVEPRAPLGVLVAASFGIDLLWPVLLLVGWESVTVDPEATAFMPLTFDAYPWSHSLAMVILWGALAALLVRLFGAQWRVAVVVGAVLVSHWFLDVVMHIPDLPLWPGGPMWGLGVWNSIPATLLLEGSFFAVTLALYARAFPPLNARGRWGLVGLSVVTFVIWATSPLAPPPPSPTMVAWAGVALWIFPFWAWRVDRNRAPARAESGDQIGQP